MLSEITRYLHDAINMVDPLFLLIGLALTVAVIWKFTPKGGKSNSYMSWKLFSTNFINDADDCVEINEAFFPLSAFPVVAYAKNEDKQEIDSYRYISTLVLSGIQNSKFGICLVTDPKGHLMSTNIGSRDIIVNPADANGVFWNPFFEIKQKSELPILESALMSFDFDDDSFDLKKEVVNKILNLLWDRQCLDIEHFLHFFRAAPKCMHAAEKLLLAQASLSKSHIIAFRSLVEDGYFDYLNIAAPSDHPHPFSIRNWLEIVGNCSFFLTSKFSHSNTPKYNHCFSTFVEHFTKMHNKRLFWVFSSYSRHHLEKISDLFSSSGFVYLGKPWHVPVEWSHQFQAAANLSFYSPANDESFFEEFLSKKTLAQSTRDLFGKLPNNKTIGLYYGGKASYFSLTSDEVSVVLNSFYNNVKRESFILRSDISQIQSQPIPENHQQSSDYEKLLMQKHRALVDRLAVPPVGQAEDSMKEWL